ncbi:circadian clock protein KaiA [Synechococcus sp. CBW1002]|uniref:circadian clock protein KaiA n=1 Tax=Synechococcus sp. CBW1002 TaxID=1353134 RepID=UPI0018CDE29B|nr:circadian clock protein KaiA [Synechococcus sp. CBW1002]QPN60062.1 circadian clock protein KaiA [Synechococcus sp. CBW1002]
MPKPALTVASLVRDEQLAQASAQMLRDGRYELVPIPPEADVIAKLDRHLEDFDVVLVDQTETTSELLQSLAKQGLLLPAVVIGRGGGQCQYHEAEVHLQPDQLEQLKYSIDAAVSRFLRQGLLHGSSQSVDSEAPTPEAWKLANRLKDRLGYLGVFYKRDAARFLRNLPKQEAQKLLQSLQRTYRDLLLSYFRDPAAANQALENFVNTAFFSDLSITKVVEIHTSLIDGLWKKVRLEGRDDDFLQDYRIALLDVMAHLCEMYRRSLPPDTALAQGSKPLVESSEIHASQSLTIESSE